MAWEWVGALAFLAAAVTPAVACAVTERRAERPAESLAGTFQRCEASAREIAKLWEDHDEPELAALHHKWVGIYQAWCEVYQRASVPQEAAAIVAGTDHNREVEQFREQFLLRLGQRVAEQSPSQHGYRYPDGCRCTPCYEEYKRRASWKRKPKPAHVCDPDCVQVDATPFGGAEQKLICGGPKTEPQCGHPARYGDPCELCQKEALMRKLAVPARNQVTPYMGVSGGRVWPDDYFSKGEIRSVLGVTEYQRIYGNETG